MPVRPRRVILSAILWTILAVVSGISAVTEQGIFSIIVALVATGVAIWFWRTYFTARNRPASTNLPASRRRR